ncbi:lipase family protein [Aureivirga marina]|uniref:lipase family protein n=1 Tax=Aureivirga marina TaxID=1182451 RepID=UPI0018C9E538|nr:hypothetical protein [Aureivirga marina]
MKSIIYATVLFLSFSFISCEDSTSDYDTLIPKNSNENLLGSEDNSPNIDIKLMMTFAAIGDFVNQHKFNEKTSVINYLKRTDLETNNEWNLKWFATNRLHGISAYITQNKNDSDIYTLTFSGTDLTNIIELQQVLKLDQQVAFSTKNPELKISKGSYDLFQYALHLKDKNKTIINYIQEVYQENPDAKFYFCGHSLGTTFLTYMSATLYELFSSENQNISIEIWLFGAPTFYTSNFVNYFLNLPFTKNFYSIEDDQIHTKYVWDFTKVYEISYPISTHLENELLTIGTNLADGIPTGNEKYVPLPSTLMENKVPIAEIFSDMVLNNFIDYLKYVEYNHNRNHYLYSIGANCVPQEYDAPLGNHCDY